MAENEHKRIILADVGERAQLLADSIVERADFLYRSGGVDTAMDRESLTAVLFVAALVDLGAQLERQLAALITWQNRAKNPAQ